MTLSEIVAGITEVAKTGGDVYSTVKTADVKEQTAVQQQKPVSVPSVATASTSTPWYKASWVIPAGIGAAVLVLVLFFVGRRRR